MADNVNISPEMIDNLVNMLKNTQKNDSSNSENSSNNSIAFNDILKNFSSNNSSNDSTNNSSNPLGNLDIQTLLKIKSAIDAINTKNDPNSNLLYSLKPYLRKSRQDKLDQYINILKISQMSQFFKNEKGDSK